MMQTFACFLLICGISAVDAGAADVAAKDATVISPSLRPSSDKKFFGKDNPADDRPKVDVLHFKHPYPAVQDSGDFDSDYVKDENKDNGSWKAQTEYDRLRHKLAKEKADVAKAEEAKKKAEDELKDAMKHEKEEEEKKKKEDEDRERKNREEHEAKKKEEAEEEARRKSGAEKADSQAKTSDELKADTSDTEKAMDELEKCKKQLAEAREKLKKLMDDLEQAKKQQKETQASLDAALKHQEEVMKGQESMSKAAEKEHQDYLDAKAAYEKQRAKVAQMEQEIKVAADRVKAMRDAEDRNGGVYPTEQRSGAASSSFVVVTLSALALLQ